ncbi:MAG: translesion error-prone DNA polymerase V autoproteolytic subunit [Pedobacter sp.]|nr:translesion error-prone DNA polymerase V autoproteolytic subunit [Chitinophagaceae bacterium]
MDQEILYRSAYNGTKDFTQQNVPTANATGFGAAADDYAERGIDLNEQLIMNKPATFFFRMNSDAMIGGGINSGDILIVDRSIKAMNGKIIVAAIDGDLMVRRYLQSLNTATLSAENKQYKDVAINEFTAFQSWGVVTCVIHILDPLLLERCNRKKGKQK